jgi:predicted ABC-type ATPase
LRLRVFAGPNGSGKSTIIKEIRTTEVNENRKLDVGIYINADDIAKKLRSGHFTFTPYEVTTTKEDLVQFAIAQGLLFGELSEVDFKASFAISGNQLKVVSPNLLDRIAQIIARFLRHALIKAKKRFSFETVFSHESNLEDMRLAAEAGYKVYLYFVGTESPEINKYRVALRVINGGHDVPPGRIEQRYYRSLEFLYDAAEIAYQTYFFDNSINDSPYSLTGHFKVIAGQKAWDKIPEEKKAVWFKKYYEKKMPDDLDDQS